MDYGFDVRRTRCTAHAARTCSTSSACCLSRRCLFALQARPLASGVSPAFFRMRTARFLPGLRPMIASSRRVSYSTSTASQDSTQPAAQITT